HLATECANKGHSATFPQALPEWFIQLFTEPGDIVLDPFMGSGTTALAAKALGRHWLGIEMQREHVAQAKAALSRPHSFQLNLKVAD
ncbi:MAG: site-specific DNA-methyltransferase, partial [Candidatus Poribacteria bacterium]|nr:site-specific DNA-methyltransferase [Candidatus Poribacteria bacterium]